MPENTIKDMTGQEWTVPEVQALVNQVGSFTTAVTRLGVESTQVLRNLGIKTPSEYVRDKAKEDKEWLPRYVIMHGSVKDAAHHLNVSVSTIETILLSLSYNTRLPLPDREAVLSAMQKFGSVIYVARLFHSTPNIIKKVIPEWKTFQDATKTGDTSVRTGTIGEAFYERIRGEKILESPAKLNRNHVGFDFLDADYGKTNVKAIPMRNNRWVWEIATYTETDTFALVQMDEAKNPFGLIIVPKSQLNDPPHGILATHRSNGDIALSTNRKFTVEV